MVKNKQYAFEEIKKSAAHNTLLAYPYFNEEFRIHTDARDFKLEDFIIQNGKSIAFFSRKLNI